MIFIKNYEKFRDEIIDVLNKSEKFEKISLIADDILRIELKNEDRTFSLHIGEINPKYDLK
jgi:hypothetical protein